MWPKCVIDFGNYDYIEKQFTGAQALIKDDGVAASRGTSGDHGDLGVIWKKT
jgi:hypothetical protein